MSRNHHQQDSSRGALVLVTGASGFIAKHTIHGLLKAGYSVRGTVRNAEETAIVEAAFDLQQLPLTLTTLDLLRDDQNAWKMAIKDCTFVVHLASPYPLGTPDKAEIIAVAKEGSLKVVKAALQEPAVEHILVVSSIYAMMYPHNRPATSSFWSNNQNVQQALTETTFTDIGPANQRLLTGYPLSKAMAEHAVWDLANKHDARHKITVINPAMVWGPMYDRVLSTSSQLAKLFLDGSYPAVPATKLPVVDVRDVAQLLVQTLHTPNVGGRRLLASSGSLSFVEMAHVLAQAFPSHAHHMPRHVLPNWLVCLLSLVDRNLQVCVADLGYDYVADATYVTNLVPGVTFRDAKQAVEAMGQSLMDQGIVSEKGTPPTLTKRITVLVTMSAILGGLMVLYLGCQK